MGKRHVRARYEYPLPLKVNPLPPVVVGNPLSIVYYIYRVLFPGEPERVLCHAVLSGDRVIVENDEDMQILWKMGFFGKGTLSRSEPMWYTWMTRKLGMSSSETLTSEEITNARREERRIYKEERERLEREVIEKKRAGDDNGTVTENRTEKQDERPETENEKIEFVPETVDGQLVQREVMQLTGEEVVFLAVALGVLTVQDHTNVAIFNYFLAKDPNFIYKYVVYHHFRSLGWCVRSGVKFGTDYILYRKGPPLSHADFAVKIRTPANEHESSEWWWNSSVGRVIGGVKKTLVFCYVRGPPTAEVDSISDIKHLLKQYTVREVVYRRWVPSRNRD